MSRPEDDRGDDATLAPAPGELALSSTIASGEFAVPDDGRSAASPSPVHHASAALDEGAPRYQRGNLLGEGGMGQVWLTRDAHIGRRVAMKIIRAETADADTRARFLREARVQGQLEHPAVVPVYDLGVGPDGQAFFTMKRVRGRTLAQILDGLRRGDAEIAAGFSPRRLLTAYSQICLAVEFAHARGVIHRDLKPDNLMLGDHGEVYVLDWGVARVLRDDLDADEERLATGDLGAAMAKLAHHTALVGTPGFIAPEQLLGRPIGPAADVFALGAILFEILTLHPLVGGSVMLARLERTVAGVDARARFAELGREVAPELAELCARATLKDVAARIGSARELHRAVEAFLDGERDLQIRRDLAERHLALGREAMAADPGDLERHKRALREVGRALAIMPDLPEARRLILRLFVATPTATPPEVEEAIEVERAHQSRLTARTGAFGMASMLLFMPILALLGIRSWLGVGVFAAMTVGAVAISAAAAAGRERRPTSLLYLVVFFNNLVFGLCAGFYGPLVLVPSMVITNTTTFALHLDAWPRRFAVATACLAVALPIALELGGVVPSSYLPVGDGIVLRPLWLAFPPAGTLVFITIGTLIAIVNGARAVAQVRDALLVAERRVQMQRWQLQQLLPEDRG